MMSRILQLEAIKCEPEEKDNLRMAALLHDVGHYPYSHLMEHVDQVILTEDFLNSRKPEEKIAIQGTPFPKHGAVGKLIVTHQQDLIDAIGDEKRALAVANIFTRATAKDSDYSNLISSSLDMDRLDYLLRDSRATGVPYGEIDIDYLLNNLKVSPTQEIGISMKALPAAEQYLFARAFMHRTVYYHKTTCAIEEACCQLLRRIRDKKHSDYGMPKDGDAVETLVCSEKLGGFTDAFVDRIIDQATQDEDQIIQALARCIKSRRPPKLLKGVEVLARKRKSHQKTPPPPHIGTLFRQNCKHRLEKICDDYKLEPGQFLLFERNLSLEKQSGLMGREEFRSESFLEDEKELIKVFRDGDPEPVSMVDIENSLINICSSHAYYIHRLYFLPRTKQDEIIIGELQSRTEKWDVAD